MNLFYILQADTIVFVTILDVNDNPPILIGEPYRATLFEGKSSSI